MHGRSVCYMHGGKSLLGVSSPSTKDGRYSRYLPARLQARYQEAASDPDLLVLRDDIALLDARLADLLTRVGSGESGARWKTVKTAYRAWKKNRDAGQDEDLRAELEAAIYAGVSDTDAWGEIHGILTQREKLVASERKRLVEMAQVLTAAEANLLITRLGGIVVRHVTDRATLAAISGEFAAVLRHEQTRRVGEPVDAADRPDPE